MTNRNFKCSFCKKFHNLREEAWGHKISYCKQFKAFVDAIMEFDYEYTKWMISNLERIGITPGSLLSSKIVFVSPAFYRRNPPDSVPLYENLYYIKNVDISFFEDSRRGLVMQRISNNAPDKNNPPQGVMWWKLRGFFQRPWASFNTFNFMDNKIDWETTREELVNIIAEHKLQEVERSWRKIFDNWQVDYYSYNTDERYFLRQFIGCIYGKTASSYGLKISDNIQFSNATFHSEIFKNNEMDGAIWTVSARSNKKIPYTKEQHEKKRKHIERYLKELKGEYSSVFYH